MGDYPTPEQCQKYRIDILRKVCPSAIPYITYAQKEGEPIDERLFNWREGFMHVLNMLWEKSQDGVQSGKPSPDTEKGR